MLTVKIKHIDMLDIAELEAWQLYQKQEDYQSPFFSLSFAKAVDACGKYVHVCVIRNRSEIVGFFPYHKKIKWFFPFLGEAERLGSEMSDYFGLLLRPGQVISTHEFLAAAGLTRIFFTHLPQSLILRGMLGDESRVGTRIILEKDGERYWSALKNKNNKFVLDTERRERAIVKEFGLLDFCFHQKNLADIDELIDIKRLQYNRTGAIDSLDELWKRNLLKKLHKTQNDDCSGVLSTLYAGNTWVASHFGLFSCGILHYWFPVYNSQLQKYSPGRLLLKQFIFRAKELGLLMIDRGEGESLAKRDFANYEQLYFRGEWHDGSMRALLCSLIQRFSWKIKLLSG